MKLFSPRESIVVAEKKHTDSIVQVAYLTTTLESLQKRINTENLNFDMRLKDLREVYGREKEALQKEVQALEESLKVLREERFRQLIPVETLKVEVQAMHGEAQARLAEIKQKEEGLDQLYLEYVNKLDEFSDRESILLEGEVYLQNRRAGIDAEAEMVSSGHIKLNGLMREFHKELSEKSKTLTLKESAFIEKERLFKITVEESEKRFAREAKILKDKQDTFERKVKRLTNPKKK